MRRVGYGPEQRYVRHLDYHLVGWDLASSLTADTTPQHYNVPGRMASVAGDPRAPTRQTRSWCSPRRGFDYDWLDLDQQKKLIADTYTGLGWYVPELLAGLHDAPQLYFDSISRVSVPTWPAGRTALLGDAAWGVTRGGMGVGTGIVGAYVLAGELAAARGDHRAGFVAYENRMRPYAARW